MHILNIIKEDFRRNSDIKIKISLMLFRLGNFNYFTIYFGHKVLYYIIKLFYKIVVEYWFNIELPLNTKVGKGLKIEHGQGLVVHYKTTIGNYVSLKHNTTIGCKTDQQGHCIRQSLIGNNIIIHPHSCIIGVTIGDDCIVGAGSIVTKDVEEKSIVAGNPAKLIKKIRKV